MSFDMKVKNSCVFLLSCTSNSTRGVNALSTQHFTHWKNVWLTRPNLKTLFQTTTTIIMIVTCICKLNVFFVCLIFFCILFFATTKKNNVYTGFCQCICDWSFLVIKNKNKNKQTIKQTKKHKKPTKIVCGCSIDDCVILSC